MTLFKKIVSLMVLLLTVSLITACDVKPTQEELFNHGAAVQHNAQANTQQRLSQPISQSQLNNQLRVANDQLSVANDQLRVANNQLRVAKNALEVIKTRIKYIQEQIEWEKKHGNSQTTIIFLYDSLSRAEKQKIDFEYKIEEIQDRIEEIHDQIQLIYGGY